MKLLIVTARYYPHLDPRAQRWTPIAEAWASNGHHVRVLTARNGTLPAFEERQGVEIYRTGYDSLKEVFYHWISDRYARGRVRGHVEAPSLSLKLLTTIYNQCWKRLYFPDDACVWYGPARRKLTELLVRDRCDALVSVSLPFTGHMLGLWARRSFPHVPWLADAGDPFTIQPKPPNNELLYGRRSRRLDERVLAETDVMTVPTEMAREKHAEVFGDAAVARMHVVPPLFHPWIEPVWNRQPRSRGGAIHLGYFGTFYAPIRTPAPLFALLDGLKAVDPPLHNRLRIHVFGDIFPEFVRALMQVPQLRLHGFRPRAEAQAEMNRMDFLVNIGNTTAYQLPSKAVNYLAAARPVINLSCSSVDAFEHFWGEWPGLLNVKVEGSRISADQIQACAEFVRNSDLSIPKNQWMERLAAHSQQAIAKRYLELLGPAAGNMHRRSALTAER